MYKLGITRGIAAELTMTSSAWTPTASSGNVTMPPSPPLRRRQPDRGRRLTPLMTAYPMWLMRCLGLLLHRQMASSSRYIPRNGVGLASHPPTRRLDK
jgi:hypothetical protein